MLSLPELQRCFMSLFLSKNHHCSLAFAPGVWVLSASLLCWRNNNMPVAFSRMQQTTVLPVSKGLMIQCPASGLVLPLSESPEPAAAAGYLGEGVLLHLQGNQLVAPFSGLCSRQDQAGQQLRFHHANGLQLDMHFPPQCYHQHGRGFDWLVDEKAKVAAGQPVLCVDSALLSQWVQPLYCLITLKQHARFSTIWYRSCYHQAGQDPLFFIELAAQGQSQNA